MRQKDATPFFRFARARHQIYLDRVAGLPAPWTEDPTLRTYRFTNVFRELDRTTVWFRENLRGPLRNHRRVVPATVIFRWFNLVETGEIIAPLLLNAELGRSPGDYESLLEAMEKAIRSQRPRGPWVTGSYMVFSGKNNGDKLTGLLSFIRSFLRWWLDEGGEREWFPESGRLLSLSDAHRLLCQRDGLSGFTAYEVVTDLRWTAAVGSAQVNSWAHVGPGATRGMSRLLYGHANGLAQESQRDQALMREEMGYLLRYSRQKRFWPQLDLDWPRWELRDVEHTLCEFDKYERVRREQGQTKRRFREEEARPLPQQESTHGTEG